MKLYPSALSSSSIQVTWAYDLNAGDVIPDVSVTIEEYGPDGKLKDSKSGLAALTGEPVFTDLQPSTQYKYRWCGVYSALGPGGDTTQCQDPREATPATTLPPGKQSGGSDLKPVIISSLDTEPATTHQGNSITVNWSSATTYNRFLVWWTENGVPLEQGEIDAGDQGSSSGSWRAQATPGSHYTFSVKGGVHAGWGNNYSDWGPIVSTMAKPNFTGLREFLQYSGVNPVGASVRSLMPPGDTLRKFMQL